jgi:hypothetical protein
MSEEYNSPSNSEKLLALHALRENMFFDQPGKYLFTDIAEDLPGPLRSAGAVIKNVLPSSVIISRDPEVRKQQIAKAIQRIKATQESHEGLGKEILHNTLSTGLGAAVPSFLLASAAHLAGFQKPWTRVNGKIQFRSPTQFSKNLNRLIGERGYAKHLAKEALPEAAIGVGLGAAHGIALPLLEHHANISDEALLQAADTIQKNPYSTSLPSEEILSTLPRPDTRLGRAGAGALLGLAAGGLHAFAPSAIKGIGVIGKNLWNKARHGTSVAWNHKLVDIGHEMRKDMVNTALIGGTLGGLGGAIF